MLKYIFKTFQTLKWGGHRNKIL